MFTNPFTLTIFILLICAFGQTLPCNATSDCSIFANSCRTSKCNQGTCEFTVDYTYSSNCCSSEADCNQHDCFIPTCLENVCLYEETSCRESTTTKNSEPGLGDILAAAVGFTILGILVLAFIIVLALLVLFRVRKIMLEKRQQPIEQTKGDYDGVLT